MSDYHKKKGLDFTFILKLSKEDREKLNWLQQKFNMSEYFRLKIQELYEKEITNV